MVLIIVLSIVTSVILLMNHLSIIDVWGAITLITICVVFSVMIYQFETYNISSKEVSLVAILSGLSAVSRVLFAPIPSVQPCTFLILATGYVFGSVPGFMIGANTAFISNLLLGQGPWTVFQMLAWGIIGVSGSALKKIHIRKTGAAVAGFTWGIMFGWIMNTWYWFTAVHPHTLTTLIFVMNSSLWFDVLHSVGNVIFILLLWDKTILILQRFKDRFHIVFNKTSREVTWETKPGF